MSCLGRRKKADAGKSEREMKDKKKGGSGKSNIVSPSSGVSSYREDSHRLRLYEELTDMMYFEMDKTGKIVYAS
eukprot:CAMPEP_0113907944 /NCGR_PEP_ID=MMETSP0780_2-20120614/25826_1 /TAXON_ID=652834 /ORGANISM="Palpitomonas bilix" /LENGTH=73 /DNA_ID=CAMNT_0000903195 /DNA_START=206 /DNA_END=424 /DNA_ORIENTATION=+ /assembly_acc=CAM_ASM_000599